MAHYGQPEQQVKAATRYIIDPDLIEWVRQEASRRRCSMSQVIRDLILAEIERRKGDR